MRCVRPRCANFSAVRRLVAPGAWGFCGVVRFGRVCGAVLVRGAVRGALGVAGVTAGTHVWVLFQARGRIGSLGLGVVGGS